MRNTWGKCEWGIGKSLLVLWEAAMSAAVSKFAHEASTTMSITLHATDDTGESLEFFFQYLASIF